MACRATTSRETHISCGVKAMPQIVVIRKHCVSFMETMQRSHHIKAGDLLLLLLYLTAGAQPLWYIQMETQQHLRLFMGHPT